MKKLLITLLMIAVLPAAVCAQADEASRAERIVGGLLDFGSAVMKQRAEKKQAQQADALPAQQVSGAEAQEPNTMEKLGKSVGVLVQGMTEPGYLAKQLGAVLKETTELTLRDYLNRYKDEGKEYARELANIITERIVNHEKIASVLDSVRMLCWGVVIYLTIISILIFFMLWRMKSTNERVLAAIEELKKMKNS